MTTIPFLLSVPGNLEWIAIIILFVLAVWLWFTALSHLLLRTFKEPTSKVVWLCLIIFFPIGGALLYRAWS